MIKVGVSGRSAENKHAQYVFVCDQHLFMVHAVCVCHVSALRIYLNTVYARFY